MSEHPYPPIFARRVSDCELCPETIWPGDPIAVRSYDGPVVHLDCALEQDEREEDPDSAAAELAGQRRAVGRRLRVARAHRRWRRAGLRRKRKQRIPA